MNRHHETDRTSARRRGRDAFSIMEVTLVLVIMGVLVVMAMPSLHLALEQLQADVAGANLRAIWSAERLYWLTNQTYTTDLTELQSLGLLDSSIVSATSVYVYAVPAADSHSFEASATRTGSSQWSGTLLMDQTGTLTGNIVCSGQPTIVPGYQ
jgi:Tfp pilus assembly protein PilE